MTQNPWFGRQFFNSKFAFHLSGNSKEETRETPCQSEYHCFLMDLLRLIDLNREALAGYTASAIVYSERNQS
jgi:hypothetical protein